MCSNMIVLFGYFLYLIISVSFATLINTFLIDYKVSFIVFV